MASCSSQCLAGLGVSDITPYKPIWLAGWAHRAASSQGVSQPIYAKTLALRWGDGSTAAVVSTDLLGLSHAMTHHLAHAAANRFGIKRAALILCASHNHSAPVTTDVLPLYYDLDQTQCGIISHYSAWVEEQIIRSMERAIEDLTPASLAFGQGLCGFAVNRRRSRPGGRSLPGVVDHDVPVLSVRRADGHLRGVVFGYACHATTSDDGKIHGDYVGYAQAAIEQAHPGAVAMFVAGCGADANPLPRFAAGLVEAYGRTLAAAVNEVLAQPMPPLSAPLRSAYGETRLPYDAVPRREALEADLESLTGLVRRQREALIRRLDADGTLPTSCSYPVQVWKFGNDLTWLTLTGEVVADYALRLKKCYGFERTWVSAYANELLAYIPSRRVWDEGGYEGTTSMMEYGHPGPFAPEIEELIVEQVGTLMRQTYRDS